MDLCRISGGPHSSQERYDLSADFVRFPGPEAEDECADEKLLGAKHDAV
jgi:hypothetical protein